MEGEEGEAVGGDFAGGAGDGGAGGEAGVEVGSGGADEDEEGDELGDKGPSGGGDVSRESIVECGGFETETDMYLSYTWRTAMPNNATTPMMTAATMMPTMIVMCPPLTAESICPAIMQLIMPYPIIRMAFKRAISFAGQYPIT